MDYTASPEATFKSYGPTQAAAYAANRGSYNESLFNMIINHHHSTDRIFDTLLDVGWGPGISTAPLAKYFDTVHGIDLGIDMISTATGISTGAETGSRKRIEFLLGRAEEMELPYEGSWKVDLITAGMAVQCCPDC